MNSPEIVTIPDAEFDNWYSGTPAGTATADNLVGAQAEPVKSAAETQPAPTDTPPAAAPVKVTTGNEMLTMEDKDFEKAAEQPAALPSKAPDAPGQPAAKPDVQAAPAATSAPQESSEVYKSMTDYLVQSGKWSDFEGRDKIELDDESYGQLVEKQDEYRLNQKWESKVAALGPYGKAILEYEANGGNAADLIEQFKAQKEAQEYGIDSKDNQLQFIRNYYEQELGWKKDRVDKHILLLEMAGDENVSAHASDLKADYDKVHHSRIEQMRTQQATFRQEQERREAEYANAISQAINKRSDITAEEKKYYIDFALKYNTQLPDGRMVNQAYVKLAQIQSNPDLYTRFLEFIDNPEKFTQKISQQEETKATKKAFQFVVGGKQKQGSAHLEIQKPEQFSFKGFV